MRLVFFFVFVLYLIFNARAFETVIFYYDDYGEMQKEVISRESECSCPNYYDRNVDFIPYQ